MYDQLADMLVIQDRAFMLQMLCLMHEKPLEEMLEILNDPIDLEKQYAIFDNKFNFHNFKKVMNA